MVWCGDAKIFVEFLNIICCLFHVDAVDLMRERKPANKEVTWC